ncbi:MAG: DNA polymerase III subunit beta [Termitinemataceae bacterium]|nr:MAG: DNA polymerase III subunit beta [Termitinemataceae bacterium]
MKFVCEKNAILTEIAIAQEIIIAKNPISILSNIYLETAAQSLIIKSSDIKINFTTKVPVSVIEEGKTTVKGDIFLGIVNSMPEGEIDFEIFDNNLIIKPSSSSSKKLRFQIPIIPVEQYPLFPSTENVNFFDINIKDFKSMIKQTIFSVSDDETRYFMTGIYFERIEDKLIMVSTDGRRLACIEQELVDPNINFEGIIIPEKILNIFLKRAGDEGNLTIGIKKSNIFLNFASYSLSSVLIEGQFPNYRKVIPDENNFTVSVNKNDLIDALKRVSQMIEKKSKRVYFQFKKEYTSIYTDKSDIGDAIEEIPCEFSGEDETVALNYSYMEDVCKAISSDKITILFKEKGKALTIKPDPVENFLHVIMPMSLD